MDKKKKDNGLTRCVIIDPDEQEALLLFRSASREDQLKILEFLGIQPSEESDTTDDNVQED